MKTIKQFHINFWILAVTAFMFSGLMTAINLSEFINIGILKQTSDYPFGIEGDTPWYYKTSKLYAIKNLIFGILFLILFISNIYALIKRKVNFLFFCYLSTLILIIVKLFSSYISKIYNV